VNTAVAWGVEIFRYSDRRDIIIKALDCAAKFSVWLLPLLIHLIPAVTVITCLNCPVSSPRMCIALARNCVTRIFPHRREVNWNHTSAVVSWCEREREIMRSHFDNEYKWRFFHLNATFIGMHQSAKQWQNETKLIDVPDKTPFLLDFKRNFTKYSSEFVQYVCLMTFSL